MPSTDAALMRLRAALEALDRRIALRTAYHTDRAAHHRLPNWRRAWAAVGAQAAKEFAVERTALVARIAALEAERG